MRLSRLLSGAGWALGTTALVSTMHSGPAAAVTVGGCNLLVTDAGGGDLNSATNVGTICDGTQFVVNQPSLPAYWEFTWGGSTIPQNIDSAITGSYSGTFTLYNSSQQPVRSASYQLLPPSLLPASSVAEIADAALTPSSNYFLGIDAHQQFTNVCALIPDLPFCVGTFLTLAPTAIDLDPPITIGFTPSAPTVDTPEPASIGLVGSGLAFLGLLRRFRRRR